jgi:cysteine-S-conjugate beta-lyase
VPRNAGQQGIEVPLRRDGARWIMDFDALEAAVTPTTRLLLLSNPQNPTGRAYTRSRADARGLLPAP